MIQFNLFVCFNNKNSRAEFLLKDSIQRNRKSVPHCETHPLIRSPQRSIVPHMRWLRPVLYMFSKYSHCFCFSFDAIHFVGSWANFHFLKIKKKTACSGYITFTKKHRIMQLFQEFLPSDFLTIEVHFSFKTESFPDVLCVICSALRIKAIEYSLPWDKIQLNSASERPKTWVCIYVHFFMSLIRFSGKTNITKKYSY